MEQHMADMNSDFYIQTAAEQYTVLNAERTRAVADLEQAKISMDYDLAGGAVQRIANIDAAITNLGNITERYVRSQQPRQGWMPSKELIHHMSVEELHATGAGPELLRAAGYFGDISDADFQRGKAHAAATRNQYR
jgi:hypothetical protein